MNTESENTKINTPAGFGEYSETPKIRGTWNKLSNFIKKNKGLIVNVAFWHIVFRVIKERVRATVSPSPILSEPTTLFVATHHKVMTTYFHAVLRLLCFALNIPFQKVNFESPRPSIRLFLSMHGNIDLPALDNYRGVHILRDPRDMIVSGYHYHKWTDEAWVHRRDENGESYQEKLNRVDRFTGLFMEIDHFIFIYRDILQVWDLSDSRILEVSYEALMGEDRDRLYETMFAHLGFANRELKLAVDLMRLFEASTRTGQKSGSIGHKSHLRSGKSGQWKKELEQAHIDYVERELDTVLRKFGYK